MNHSTDSSALRELVNFVHTSRTWNFFRGTLSLSKRHPMAFRDTDQSSFLAEGPMLTTDDYPSDVKTTSWSHNDPTR